MKKNTATLPSPGNPLAGLREPPTHEDIAGRARDLWLRYGQPTERDEQIWLEAEAQLLGKDARARPEHAPGEARTNPAVRTR